MANVRFKLNFLSSTTTSDRLDFTVERAVPVVKPYGALARTEADDSTPTVLSGTNNPMQMVYIKNLDPSNDLHVLNNAGEVMSVVRPHLFVLIGVPASAGIEVLGINDPVEIEYGFWSLP